MKTHIMVDIETLSTSTWNACITQIGAVRFNSKGVSTLGRVDQFLVGVDTAPQMRMGRVMDEDTMRWWDEQDGSPFLKDYFHPSRALQAFSDWVGHMDPIRIWANGIVFDGGNLWSLYDQYELDPPWQYNSWTDMRTLRRWWGMGKPMNPPTHNALQDAIDQANLVVEEARNFLDAEDGLYGA